MCQDWPVIYSTIREGTRSGVVTAMAVHAGMHTTPDSPTRSETGCGDTERGYATPDVEAVEQNQFRLAQIGTWPGTGKGCRLNLQSAAGTQIDPMKLAVLKGRSCLDNLRKEEEITMRERCSKARSESNGGGLTRRQVVRGLLAGAGAGIAMPAAASDLLSGGLAAAGVSGSEAKVASKASEGWQPLFLDEHQNATLIVLGERIAPGSSKAQVNRFIDLLLSVLPEDASQGFLTGDNNPGFTLEVRAPARQRLLDALGAFDGEARKRFGAPFKVLSEAQQLAILNDAAQAPAQAKTTSPKIPQLLPTEKPVNLHDRFDDLKNWIIGAYYSSEAGTRALGWSGDLYFPSFPGCPSSERNG